MSMILLAGSTSFLEMKKIHLSLARKVINAVKDGRINELPPHKGPAYKLGKDVMDLLSDLFFSHNALSQHNADGQISRQQYISVL